MISKVTVIRIFLFHLCSLGVFFVGVSWAALAVFLLSFVLRSFGVGAGYHRYLTHRSFQTSRSFQFLLAFLGASSGQRGPLSWVTSHRVHHSHADQPGDPHSPQQGFFHAYIGWLLPQDALPTDLKLTADLAQYPELRWLNKYHNVATLTVILLCAALGAWLGPAYHTGAMQLVVWGFVLSGLLSLHATLLVNSVCHLGQGRDSRTQDFSRNVPWLLPLTLGECWHYNHHRFPKSANCGIESKQIDFIYLGIRALEKLGLVWDIKTPKPDVFAHPTMQFSSVSASPPATRDL